MRVSVTHTTRLDYSTDVVEAVMDTRLGPFSDMHQRWDGYETVSYTHLTLPTILRV